jgi:uncharacterized protein YxjI
MILIIQIELQIMDQEEPINNNVFFSKFFLLYKCIIKMGASISKQHEYIVPQPQHIHVLNDCNFCSYQESGFVLSKKIGTEGDFKIKDEQGNKFANVINKKFRFTNEKTIYNDDGPLVVIKKKPMGIFGKSYNVYSPQNDRKPLLTITSHFKIALTKVSVKVHDLNTGIKFKIILQGDFLNRSAKIYKGNPKKNGEPIALLTKCLTLRSIISKEYTITIASGVDQLLMIILSLIFDDIHTEKKQDKKTTFSIEV